MKRTFVSSIVGFCLAASFVFAQEVKLNVVAFDPCKSAYEDVLIVHLMKDGKIVENTYGVGTILLPEPGRYRMKVFGGGDFYRITDSVKYVTVVTGQNYDTLTQTTIKDCVNTSHGPDCGYFCCDELCEGYNVDYFDNGKTKIEGHFKKGFPVGKMIFYRPNGKKKEIHYYDESGSGRLIKKDVME